MVDTETPSASPAIEDPRRARTEISEDSPTEELIAWAFARFAHLRMVLTTAFGMEGCALIDMLARHRRPVTVVYVDTMFFFPETYELRDRLVAKYAHLEFLSCRPSLTPQEQVAKYGAELWRSDPDLCCKLRKIDPLLGALRDVDVWITGLRRSQSLSRANIRVLEWDWAYQLLKMNPLARWSRKQVWQYVQANDVPYNPLHERGYPSVGCIHCTAPVEGAGAGDYSRAGRWNGLEKTECGMHGDGI